jgi:hypothetical protein
MAKLGSMMIKGASGTTYEFTVYSGDTLFKPVGSVYVVSKRTPKRDGGGEHDFLYIGEAGDLSERFDDHHKQRCFDTHGANCISVLPKTREDERLRIEEDILGNGGSWPCND